MAIKKRKPITPGQRFLTTVDYSLLTKTKPLKSHLYKTKKISGRNNTGRITVPHRGGGHKRRGRIIDFKRRNFDIEGTVKTIEYDPMRTAFIMLVAYRSGQKFYHIAPKNIQVGDTIVSGEKVAPKIGNAMPLKSMPVGTTVHNIELNPGAGAALARSAGSQAQLIARHEKNIILKLPSGETRMVNKNCIATVGIVSNTEHNATIDGKAGRKRWRGERPRTRATVKNPCDHRMGGGEGKATGGHPSSKAGLYAKGARTRNKKKYSAPMIIKRRK